MRYTYKVVLTPEEEDNGYTVTCDDLYGLVTCGDDVQDAISMAADALATYIGAALAGGRDFPKPTDYAVPEGAIDIWVSFETDADYVMEPCVSAAEAARMLGVTPGRVSQMVSSGQLKANRKAGHVWVEINAIEERLAQERHAGRPRRELAGA